MAVETRRQDFCYRNRHFVPKGVDHRGSENSHRLGSAEDFLISASFPLYQILWQRADGVGYTTFSGRYREQLPILGQRGTSNLGYAHVRRIYSRSQSGEAPLWPRNFGLSSLMSITLAP